MNTSEILNKAADVIQSEGWSGGGNYTPDGNCASNVISRVADDYWSDAHRALLAHLGGREVYDIFSWNDHPGRTANEVIEALRATAVIEAARESEHAEVSA